MSGESEQDQAIPIMLYYREPCFKSSGTVHSTKPTVDGQMRFGINFC